MSTYLKSIIKKLSPESRSTLDSAINYAISRSHHEVDCLHFLWKILQEHKSITEKFSELSLFNPDRVLHAIESELILINTASQSSPVFSESMQTLLEKTWIHASIKWQSNHIDIPVLLTTLITLRDSILPYNVVGALYCDVDVAEKLLLSLSVKTEHSSHRATDNAPHEYINKYTENFSLLAETGKLDPVTGREKEIRQLIDILLRRRQNNPILTGEPGVGKSSIVEGLEST